MKQPLGKPDIDDDKIEQLCEIWHSDVCLIDDMDGGMMNLTGTCSYLMYFLGKTNPLSRSVIQNHWYN